MSQNNNNNEQKVTEIILPPSNTIEIEKDSTEVKMLLICFKKFETSDSTNSQHYLDKFVGFTARLYRIPKIRVKCIENGALYKVYSKETDKDGNRSFITVKASKTPGGFKILDHGLIKVGEDKNGEKAKNFGPFAISVFEELEEQVHDFSTAEYDCTYDNCGFKKKRGTDSKPNPPFYKSPGVCISCDSALRKRTSINQMNSTVERKSLSFFRPLD